jgi:hypothetical protein
VQSALGRIAADAREDLGDRGLIQELGARVLWHEVAGGKLLDPLDTLLVEDRGDLGVRDLLPEDVAGVELAHRVRDLLDRVRGLVVGRGGGHVLGDGVEAVPAQAEGQRGRALGVTHLIRDADRLGPVQQRLGGAPQARDPVAKLDLRAVVDRLEEVLPALFGLGHDRADVRGVVAQPAIGAGLQAAADADHDQDQEADADADRDQAAHQNLLALSLRPRRAPRWALWLGGRDNLFFFVEESHDAQV